MNLNQQSTRFARMSGETWLRPEYANAIEHYKPVTTHVNGYSLVGLVLLILSLVGVAAASFKL
jgi:hypothetical protein